MSLFIDAITGNRCVYVHTGGRIPQRWVFAIMGFLALFNAYAMRVCLSITITEMVVPMHKNETNVVENTCPITDDDRQEGEDMRPSNAKKYEWSETMQVKIYTRAYIRVYICMYTLPEH